ncbi:hypothetical protein ACFXAW_10390 [Streptomyces sp. NPDC059445]|uniref:hypothetical protein n=1 Tax=unclassified Streptomyces TaxID=2593676 RepID=UPI0036AFEFEB
MRTNTISAAHTALVAVVAILATGCGAGAGAAASAATTTPAPSASAPFGQKDVRRDLRAAIAAAGLTGGKVEAGQGASKGADTPTNAEQGDKAAALADRLTPCVVSWSSTEKGDRSTNPADPAGARRQMKAMLSGLVARGWKQSTPPQNAPVGGDATYFMASYKKKGWVLYARHLAAPTLGHMTVMATDVACFNRLTTPEERALIEKRGL